MGSAANGPFERADVLIVVVLGGVTLAEVAMLEQTMADTGKQVCLIISSQTRSISYSTTPMLSQFKYRPNVTHFSPFFLPADRSQHAAADSERNFGLRILLDDVIPPTGCRFAFS